MKRATALKVLAGTFVVILLASAFPAAEMLRAAWERPGQDDPSASTGGKGPGSVPPLPFDPDAQPPGLPGEGPGASDPSSVGSGLFSPGFGQASSRSTGSALLDQVIGSAKLMGYDVEVPPLPVDELAPTNPLRAAILQWIAVTGSPVDPQDLAVELAKADALPQGLQRDLAILVLSAGKASLLQAEALARLTPEQVAWVHSNPQVAADLAQGVDSPDTRRMAALAALVDTPRSIQASLLLLQAVEATRGSLAKADAAQALGGLPDASVHPTTRALLALLAASGARVSDADKVRLAAELVAASSGFALPGPAPRASFREALAALLSATGQPVDPEQLALVLARADALPSDLQAALAGPLMAQARAVEAADPRRGGDQAQALVGVLLATADALPALEKYAIYWREAPSALRVGQWTPTHRAGWVAEHAALFAGAGASPADLVRAGALMHGLGLLDAQAPERSFVEAFAALSAEAGHVATPGERSRVESAAATLEPAVRDAAALMMSGAAEASRLRREAFAALGPDEERALYLDAMGLDALLAKDALSAEELALLARVSDLSRRVDGVLLAKAGVVGARATMEARDVLAGQGAYAVAASQVEPVPLLGWLSKLLPFGSARAQGVPTDGFDDTAAACQTDDLDLQVFVRVQTSCANDVLLRISFTGFATGGADCDARSCNVGQEHNSELLVLTGTRGSTLTPQVAQRFLCDMASSGPCPMTPAAAYGAPLVHLDLGGADTYHRPVAMTSLNTTAKVSLHLDVSGADSYLDPSSHYDGRSPFVRAVGLDNGHPTQGSALFGGVAILLDGDGDDTYLAPTRSQGFGRYGVGLLADLGGNDRYRGGVLSQGASGEGFNLGLGILLDARGDDTRTAASGQGYGLGGVLLDLQGRDSYANGHDALGVPAAQLDVVPGGNLTSLSERRNEAAWTDGPGALNLGIGLDQEATVVGSGDRDGDGWSDFLETVAGSDPSRGSEGVPQGPGSRAGKVAADADADLYPDFVERALSTDPHDAKSYPAGFPRGPTFHDPLGLYGGGVTPGDEAPRAGLAEGSDKVLDLRLPLQDAGGIDPPCTGAIFLNITDPLPVSLPGQRIPVDRPPAAGGDTVTVVETPGVGGTENHARRADGSTAPPGDESRNRCVFVSYETSAPGQGNASQPYAGQPAERRTFRFQVPAGILAVGDVVATRYDVDYFFVVDLGGNDVFNNSAGGALPVETRTNPYTGPGGTGGNLNSTAPGVGNYDHAFLAPSLALSIDPFTVADVPTSRFLTNPDDAPGNDRYAAPATRDFAHGALWGVLLDTGGRDNYTAGGGSQGSLGGVLLDLAGADTYRAGNLSQGASVGLPPTRDVEGYPQGGANPSRDAVARRSVPGLLLDYGDEADSFTAASHSQGFARGFTDDPICLDARCLGPSPSAYGILLSQGGADLFDVRSAGGRESQGVGTQTGVGILLDTDGADRYLGIGPFTQGATLSQSTPRPPNGPPPAQPPGGGVLVDLGGFDAYLHGTVAHPERQNNLTLHRAPMGFTGDTMVYADPGVHLDAQSGDPVSLVNALGGTPRAADPDAANGFLVHLPTARLAIGGEEDTHYRGTEYALVVDLGGVNRYDYSAGGLVPAALGSARPPVAGPAGPFRQERPTLNLYPVSLLFDAGSGAGEYVGGRAFSQGAGLFSVGVLVDAGGDDRMSVLPERLPALNNSWMPTPPIVDGAIDPTEWAGVRTHNLTFASVNDSRLLSTFTVRVANDADNLYVAVQGRTAAATPEERREDRFVLALDRGATRLVSAPAPGAKGAYQTYLDGLVLGMGLTGCEVRDRHWNGTASLPDLVLPLPEVKVSCASTETGQVSFEIQKPLREGFPRDLGDLNLPYDPVVGWTEFARLGLHMEFVEPSTDIVWSWPPGTTVRDGEAGFRADGNLSDEMSAWAVASLANLGNATPLPSAARVPSFSQGAGVAGVGVLALLGGQGSNAHLNASDRAQGYGGFGGLGVLLDAGGSDHYQAGHLAQGAAETQGFGLFIDAEGNDRYESTSGSLGHATDGTASALFLDLYGYDSYSRLPPTLTVAATASADLTPGAAPGNERVWTQGAGAGADYSLTTALRKAVAGVIEPTQFGPTRTNLSVTQYLNGACTDQPVLAHPSVGGPRPIVTGEVCLRADVNLEGGDPRDPFGRDTTEGGVTVESSIRVDSVDFLLDGTSFASGRLVEGDPDDPGTRSTWTYVLNGSELGDGIRKVAALAIFRVQQEGQGAVLFYDDVDPADDANPAVRSVYVNNPPQVGLGLLPPFTGVAGAAFSPSAALASLRQLRADYAVSRDAGEDGLALAQGWSVPARFSNVPCDEDETRLCNLLPLYFRQDSKKWDTTPRGNPAERQTKMENSRGNAPFQQETLPLAVPLNVTKKNSFHLALPDHRTTLPRSGEYKTHVTLRLRDADGADYKVDGQPVVLFDGVFSSWHEPLPIETALNLFSDLRAVTDPASENLTTLGRGLQANPLEALVAALVGPCSTGGRPAEYCDQFEGNPGAANTASTRLCRPDNPLATLRNLISSTMCSPTLRQNLEREAQENENAFLNEVAGIGGGALVGAGQSLDPPPASALNWTDYYFDVDTSLLEDIGDSVVIPAGATIQITISSLTELFDDTGGAVTATYGDVVDAYLDAAGQAKDASPAPLERDVFGVPVDPLGEVGVVLGTSRSNVADTEKRVSSLTVLPFSLFTYQGGGEEQARLEIRTPADATTRVEATIETPTGQKVMDLAAPRALQGDRPGSPTRDGRVDAPGAPTRFVPASGERFTQVNATFDGNVTPGSPLADGLYRVRVKATDFSGRASNQSSAFLLDRLAPQTRIDTRSFAGAAYVENNALPVLWSAIESGSGLSRVAVYGRAGGSPSSPDWGEVGPGKWQLLGVFPASVRATSFTLTASDTYWFASVGEDRVGNVEGVARQGSEADPFLAGFRAKLAQPNGVLKVVVDQTRPALLLADDAILGEGARVVDYRGADVAFVKAGAPVAFRACAGDEREVRKVIAVFDQVNDSTKAVTTRSFEAARVGACADGQSLYEYVGWGDVNHDKSVFPDGAWSVSFEAFDAASNRIQANLATVILDSQAPSIHLHDPVYPVGQSAVKPGDVLSLRLLPQDAFGVDEAAIVVDASALNRTGLLSTRAVRVDGILVQEATFRVDVPVENVVYGVKVLVRDNAGNLATDEFLVPVDVKTFTIDPASLRVTNVTHNGAVLRWSTSENATSQARFGISPLDLRQRSVLVQNLTKEHALKVEGLAPSTRYFIRALSTSAGGYVNESDPVEFTTNTSLFLEAVSPAPGAKLSGAVPLAFKGGLLDSAGFVTYSLEVQPRPDADWSFVTTLTRQGTDHTVSFNSSRHLDGNAYRLKLSAEAGKDRASVLFGPYLLDNTPPSVDVRAPLVATNDTTPRVEADLRDDLAGLGAAPATLLIDGRPVEGAIVVEPTPEGARVSYEVPSALAPGAHAFELRVQDRAGANATETWKVSIDGDAPEVSVNPLRFAPGASAAKAGGTVTINLTVTDASGVSLVGADASGLSTAPDVRFSRIPGTDFFVATIPVSAAEETGSRRVAVHAIDLAGNLRQHGVDVPVDNLPPRVGEARPGVPGHTAIDLALSAGSEPVVLVGTATAPGSPTVTASTTEPRLAPTLSFQGLLPSRSYAYVLKAVDGAGNEVEVSGRFSTRDDVVKPGVAPGLAVADLLNGTLRLTWEPATDDVGVSHYRVYRSEDGVSFRMIAEVQETAYDDAGLPLEKTFHYQVVAVDHGANEGLPTERLKAAATALPRLSAAAASPTVGTPSTTFRWTITYASPGGKEPAHVRVILDGVPQTMVRQEGGSAVDGLTYVYETRLAPHKRDEPHTHSFEASDGRYTVKFPEDGSALRGPLVSGDLAAEDGPGGFAGFAQRVPLGGAAATAFALLLALAVVALVVRKKKEGPK